MELKNSERAKKSFTSNNVRNLPYFTLSDKHLFVTLDMFFGEGPKAILAPYKIMGGGVAHPPLPRPPPPVPTHMLI